MGIMKNKAGLLGLYLAGAMMSGMDSKGTRVEMEKPKESEEARRKRLSDFEKEKKEKQGLIEFFYQNGEVSFWARNEKNADRKYSNYLKNRKSKLNL